jgi:hypothetical protein
MAALSFIFCAASPSEAQCTDATATRPILFVPGIWEGATDWGTPLVGLRESVISQLSSTPGYLNSTFYNLYFDGANVRLAQAPIGDPFTDPVASSVNVPCDARNFAISFYGWTASGEAFDPSMVANVSILTKAYELSQVLKAIAALTYVQDAIVVAHSMGALDTRAYVEGLGSTYAPCQSVAQLPPPCYLPGTLVYTGEVGHLITLDGANAGAYIANFVALGGWLGSWLGFGATPFNVAELELNSTVISALNYNGGYPDQLGTDAYAHSLPSGFAIDAIVNYYTFPFVPCTLPGSIFCIFCTWDEALTNDSQSIVDPLLGKGFEGLSDFPNSFATTDVGSDPSCVRAGTPILHLLPCLGDYHSSAQVQTGDLVYQRVLLYLVGQLTTINIQTTYNNGQQYEGSIALALQTPNASVSITNPQWTLRGPQVPPSPQVTQVPPISPAPYTLTYVSGGPAGAGAPTIQGQNADGSLCSPCYLQPGNWALTFSVSFPSGPPSPPTATTQ